MKFKRELTVMEIQELYPPLLEMKAEVEAAGGKCYLRVLMDQDIAADDIAMSHEGMCSNCKSPVVQITWKGILNGTPMEFTGLACPECEEILEFAGTNTGPFDLKKMLGL